MPYQARPDINAVHTPPYATMLSCLTRQFLRSITWLKCRRRYDSLRTLCHVRFRSVGAEGCRDTLGKDRLGCLLSHHGSVAGGRNLKQAYAVALEIESLCSDVDES